MKIITDTKGPVQDLLDRPRIDIAALQIISCQPPACSGKHSGCGDGR